MVGERQPNILWIDPALGRNDCSGRYWMAKLFQDKWNGLTMIDDPCSLISKLGEYMCFNKPNVAVIRLEMDLPNGLTHQELFVAKEGMRFGLAVAWRMRSYECLLGRKKTPIILTCAKEDPRDAIYGLGIRAISIGRDSVRVLEYLIKSAIKYPQGRLEVILRPSFLMVN